MHRKRLLLTATVSTWLLTFLTPLTTSGQAIPKIPNIPERSCEGIGKPLTKANIVERAVRLGIKNESNAIEYKFEKFALKSMSLKKYTGINIPSKRRAAITNGRKSGVDPDAITDIIVTPIVNGILQEPITYANSGYIDAKLMKGSIGPANSDYQPIGFIDALINHSEAGKSQAPLPLRPNPRLVYLTSADTKMGRQTIVAANKNGIGLIQHVVCDFPNGTFGVNDLVMGKGILLNPGVYIGRPLPVGEPGDNITFSPGTPGSLEPDTPPQPPEPPTCSGSGC